MGASPSTRAVPEVGASTPFKPDGRRLAGAVVAEEAKHLPCLDLQGQVVDGNHLPEVTGQPVGDERCV
jgi:hypothetical protein